MSLYGIDDAKCLKEVEGKETTITPDILAGWLKATVGHSCRNLLFLDVSAQGSTNLAYSFDRNVGKVRVYGTASAQAIFTIGTYQNTSDTDEKLYLSGGLDGGSGSTYALYAYDTTENARPKKWDGVTTSSGCINSTESQEILVPSFHTVEIRFVVQNGVSISSSSWFYPMLRDGGIASNSFDAFRYPAVHRTLTLYEGSGDAEVTCDYIPKTACVLVTVKDTSSQSSKLMTIVATMSGSYLITGNFYAYIAIGTTLSDYFGYSIEVVILNGGDTSTTWKAMAVVS